MIVACYQLIIIVLYCTVQKERKEGKNIYEARTRSLKMSTLFVQVI